MSRIMEAAMLGRYPDAPGWKREETSHKAAVAAGRTARNMADRVLEAIRAAGADGLTADEAAAAVGIQPYMARPRVTELRARGAIVKSDRRRPSANGNQAIVWIIAKRNDVDGS